MRYLFYKLVVFTLILQIIFYLYWSTGLWSLIVLGPLTLMGFMDIYSSEHTIRRNFPIIGSLRYFLETIRPEIMQYFVESDTDGRPINRIFRSLVYRRSKKVTDTTPFGTQQDVYEMGYEWMSHSMFPISFDELDHDPKVLIGGPDCTQKYEAGMLNISAMSFGSLSKNAILALNGGAKKGGFYHNTGEGAISPFHLKPGGDLVWQIGTGYFGCRNSEGKFDIEKFREKATGGTVRMIEIKLSQGAKPGHGGILPAAKNTKEIAEIRGVEAGSTVFSPPYHSAFDSLSSLLDFIVTLREASGSKPVGFKLCVGKPEDFVEICKKMVERKIKPDFITVDGGEGGTGAAPVEFSNSLGMPLRDGLSFVHDTLIGYGLRKDIKLIASGKILTGFHMVRALALGADLCNSARGFMLSMGCIQALKCNTNDCPTGVATQNRMLMRGLNPATKADRVANFQAETVKAFIELVAAAGLKSTADLQRKHIYRRASMTQVLSYDRLYPLVDEGSLL